MNKLVLLFLILPCLSVSASELTEDYFDIASDYCTCGKYRQALEYVEKIIAAEPSNTDALELKNAILRVINPYSKSYLTRTYPNIKKSVDYKNEGNRSGEISSLTSGNNYWSYFLLGRIYLENGDYTNAISSYKKAIENNPENSQPYLGLAEAYIGISDYNNALTALNTYLGKNPNSDIAYALRAETYLNLNDVNNAENDIEKAVKIDENIAYLLTKGKILYKKGDYNSAIEILNKLSRNVQTSEVYKYIGLCDYALNDYANALINLDKAIILSDDDKDLAVIYNKVKGELGENEKGNDIR